MPLEPQPRRSNRQRKPPKHLQETLGAGAGSVAHSPSRIRYPAPPLPKLPAAPPPPPPPPPLRHEPSASPANQSAYLGSVNSLVRHVHGGSLPTPGEEEMKSCNESLESHTLQIPIAPNGELWSRISLPSTKEDIHSILTRTVRDEKHYTPTDSLMPYQSVISSAENPIDSNVTEEHSHSVLDQDLPKWKLHRPLNSLSSKDSQLQSSAENPQSSFRKRFRSCPVILNSESTSESSVRAHKVTHDSTEIIDPAFCVQPQVSNQEDVDTAALPTIANVVFDPKKICPDSIVGSNEENSSTAADSSNSGRSESNAETCLSLRESSIVPNSGSEARLNIRSRTDEGIAERSVDDGAVIDTVGYAFGEDSNNRDPFQELFSEKKLDLWVPDNPEPCSEVHVSQLLEFIKKDNDVWVNPPIESVLGRSPSLLSPAEARLWKADSRNPLQRRVMIWSLAINRVVLFEKSPTVSQLPNFLEDANYEVLSHRTDTSAFVDTIPCDTANDEGLAMNKVTIRSGEETISSVQPQEMDSSSAKNNQESLSGRDNQDAMGIDEKQDSDSTEFVIPSKPVRSNAEELNGTMTQTNSGCAGSSPDILERSIPIKVKRRNFDFRPLDGTPKRRKLLTALDKAVLLTSDNGSSNCNHPSRIMETRSLPLRLRLRPSYSGPVLRLRIKPELKKSILFSKLLPKLSNSFIPEPGATFRSFVFHKVILRLRGKCMLPFETGKDPDKDPIRRFNSPTRVVWDSKSLRKVMNDKTIPCTYGDPLRTYLVFNPDYEPYTGQDILIDIGKSKHMQLIPVSEKTPSHLVRFWNRKQRRTESHEKRKGDRRTVGSVTKNKYMDLYVGQDFRGNDVGRALRATASMYRARGIGLVPHRWVLSKRPVIVSELIHNGWFPKIISVHLRKACETVFWDKIRGGIHLTSPLVASSVAEYLDTSKSRFELYTGQELPTDAYGQLNNWFDLLKWGPGCRFNDMFPVLDGLKAAKAELGGQLRKNLTSKGMDKSLLRKGRSLNKRPRDISGLQVLERREKIRASDRRCRERKRGERDVSGSRNDYAAQKRSGPIRFGRAEALSEKPSGRCAGNVKELHRGKLTTFHSETDVEKFQGCTVSDKKAAELRKLKSDDCILVRNTKCNVVLPLNICPTVRTLSEFIELFEDYEVFDEHFTEIDELDHAPYLLARASSEREATRIRHVVCAVMSRAVRCDVLDKIRDLLEEELTVCGAFDDLLASMSNGELVEMALQLVDSLEALDVNNLFSSMTDYEFGGPADLLSIREGIEQGGVYLAHDVFLQFVNACTAQIQSNPEFGVLWESAKVLLAKGQQCYSYFFDEHLTMMRRDKFAFRLRDLVNQAHGQIIQSLVEFQPVKVLQRNAHLNFRDEDGNSIMCQGMSSKVLGILLDRSPGYLDNIDNRKHWQVDRKCHLCENEVDNAFNDAFVCSNRLFGQCSRIVCRQCLFDRCSLNNESFIELRGDGKWVCMHCRNICCSKNVRVDPGHGIRRKVMCRFELTHTGWIKKGQVDAVFRRRMLDGVFNVEETSFGKESTIITQNGNSFWQCRLELPVGLYHVDLLMNGDQQASTVLYVFPIDDLKSGRSSHVDVGPPRVSLQPNTCPPKVVWQPGEALGRHSVQSLRCEPIQVCSRTEGYNWGAAKRHALQAYRPVIVGSVPLQRATCIATNVVPIVPVEDVPVIGSIASPSFHEEVRIKGKTYSEYETMLNSVKVRRMLKESVWSLVVARSTIHGNGLFTLSGYGTDDFIVEYTGEVIRNSLSDVREPRYDKAGFGSYMFRVDDKTIVDATIRSNRSRFLNHSCDPNLKATIVKTQERTLIVLQAARPIPPFSELTFDYKLPEEERSLDCMCKSWNCSGKMN